MDTFAKRVEKFQKFKYEIDEFVAQNSVELHPRLRFLIPWLQYSYSIFSRQYEKQKLELGDIKNKKETFKTNATKLTVSEFTRKLSGYTLVLLFSV